MKTIAQRQISSPIFIQKCSFMGKKAPLKPFVAPKSDVASLSNPRLKNLSAAYFHPSFGSNIQEIKQFSKMLDFIQTNPEKTTQKFSEKFEKLFNDSIWPNFDEKTYIHEGKFAEVHTIDKKYVCKFFKPDYRNCEAGEIIDPQIINSLKNWYGGEVARIGNISILKNADPKRIAIPVGAPINTPYRQIAEYYKKNCLSKMKNMPQEAFDKVANDFKILNSFTTPKGEFYVFDTENPNNFLLVGNEIRITDELEPTCHKNQNNLASMTNAFLFKTGFLHNAKYDEEIVSQRKEILKKCVIANEKAELPLYFTTKEKLTLSSVLDLVGDNNRTEDRYESVDRLTETLQAIRDTFSTLEERIEAIKNYIECLG